MSNSLPVYVKITYLDDNNHDFYKSMVAIVKVDHPRGNGGNGVPISDLVDRAFDKLCKSHPDKKPRMLGYQMLGQYLEIIDDEGVVCEETDFTRAYRERYGCKLNSYEALNLNDSPKVCLYKDSSKRYRYSCDEFVVYANCVKELYEILGYYPAMRSIKRVELATGQTESFYCSVD